MEQVKVLLTSNLKPKPKPKPNPDSNPDRASESPDYINWGTDAPPQPSAPPERKPGEHALDAY